MKVLMEERGGFIYEMLYMKQGLNKNSKRSGAEPHRSQDLCQASWETWRVKHCQGTIAALSVVG